MTNNDVSHDERLSAALGRYEGRFQPAEADWSVIEARHESRSVSRALRHGAGWKLHLTVVGAVVTAVAAAVTLVAVNTVSIHIGQSPAQATSVPAAPSYRPVIPRPVFPAGSTMAAIQARGFIRVGVKDDQPTFGFRDPTTGVWSGFDIEMAKLIAAGIFGGDVAQAEAKIIFMPVISANREADIETGKVDMVIATYTINAAREQVVDFAGPYFRAHQDIMVKAGDSAIQDVTDLNGRKVCTVRGSTSYQNLLVAAPRVQVTLLNTYSACAQMLAAGKVEAVTTDDVILAGLVHEHGNTFRLLNIPFSDEPYGIGLKKGDDTFRAFVNARLATIEADGDWALAESYALQGIQSFTPPPIAD